MEEYNNVLFISQNKNGDFYVGIKVVNNRGINPKAKRKADELLIIGVPKAKISEFCAAHNIKLEDK